MTAANRPSKVRALAVAGVAALSVSTLALVGCSSGSSDSSSESTTTESLIGGNVVAPVIMSPDQSVASVGVGAVIVFDMGDPNGGTWVATSDKPSVVEITSEGKKQGSATFNAGGKAVGKGEAKVTVVFKGSANGVGTPQEFTITVQ